MTGRDGLSPAFTGRYAQGDPPGVDKPIRRVIGGCGGWFGCDVHSRKCAKIPWLQAFTRCPRFAPPYDYYDELYII